MKAFMDTAAIMRHLDLIITSDTAIAHIAGALGVNVWVALPTNCDWRWLRERADSPWYPTMRLFRQPARGDWAAVFAEMARAMQSEFEPPKQPAARRLGAALTSPGEFHRSHHMFAEPDDLLTAGYDVIARG